MKNFSSSPFPLRAARMGAPGHKQAVTQVEAVFIKRRRSLRIRFLGPRGETDLEISRVQGGMLFDYLAELTALP